MSAISAMNATNAVQGHAAYSAASAMNAFGVGMAVSAHNVANVNTAGFQPQATTYATGPQGQGVQAQVMPPTSPSALSGPAGVTDSAAPSTASVADADAASGIAGVPSLPPEAPSGTEPVREFVAMSAAQNAYAANAVSIRAWDETLGVIVDMKV